MRKWMRGRQIVFVLAVLGATTPAAMGEAAFTLHTQQSSNKILLAQIANPAAKARERDIETETEQQPLEELPPVTVEAEALPGLAEEALVGPYNQPRWTIQRPFSTTRVYVQPPGVVEAEFWFIAEVPEEGENVYESQFEISIGLPHRFQLDLYFIPRWSGDDNSPILFSQSVELRYALADWGEIPGNPTLYAEYIIVGKGPDVYELKALFGGGLAPGWHYGVNLVFERVLGGEYENEYAVTAGISKTIIDRKLSLGAEVEVEVSDESGNRFEFEGSEVLIGPTIQYHPSPRTFLNITPLFGVTEESPTAEVIVTFGIRL